ncbi:MAG: hypothetical protein V1734_01150 [Nanoarchaeota archaeon]
MEEDGGRQGIAIRNQIYDCKTGNLITEEAEHRDYGTEANFYKEGIRLTQLSRHCIENGTLLIPNEEIDSLLSIFNLWEKRHESLPGSKSYGHSWCGWLSTDYFAAGSDKPEFAEYNPKSRVDSARKKSGNNNSKQVEEWKEKAEKLKEELNEKLKGRLSTKTLEAKISRFELELRYKESDTKGLLTENDIAAFRDFAPLYGKRRSRYS